VVQVRVQLTQGAPNPTVAHDNLVAQWGGIPYAQLSVVLVHLRFVGLTHQTHHWVAQGDPFYGDHLLFERLYKTTLEEVDHVAEKVVGLSGDQNVNLTLQLQQLNQLVSAYAINQAVPQSTDLVRRSMLAETNLINVVDTALLSMQEDRSLTPGVENTLQGIADVHEGNVYLLKRRCAAPALGM
jgi:DNA-binding ferritin-like protein